MGRQKRLYLRAAAPPTHSRRPTAADPQPPTHADLQPPTHSPALNLKAFGDHNGGRPFCSPVAWGPRVNKRPPRLFVHPWAPDHKNKDHKNKKAAPQLCSPRHVRVLARLLQRSGFLPVSSCKLYTNDSCMGTPSHGNIHQNDETSRTSHTWKHPHILETSTNTETFASSARHGPQDMETSTRQHARDAICMYMCTFIRYTHAVGLYYVWAASGGGDIGSQQWIQVTVKLMRRSSR